MPINTLPTVPSRLVPATFVDDTDAFLSALPAFVTEANALETNVNAKETSASEAASTANIAAVSAQLSALTAAAAGTATKWVSGTTYAIGDGVWSPTDYLPYRRLTAGAGTTDPVSDATNWIRISGTRLVYETRSSNTSLHKADSGRFIDITSGTFSQTIDAVSVLGEGWFCYLRNSGTGTVTIDPNSSETIDGAATAAMTKGDCRIIMVNGGNLTSAVITQPAASYVPTVINSMIPLIYAGL